MKLYNIINTPSVNEVGCAAFEKKVLELKKLDLKYDILSAALEFVTSNYKPSRARVLVSLPELLSKNLMELSSRHGFMYCTNQNALLANLLLKSGRFTPKDIRTKWTIYLFLTPHQYLQVKTENGWLDVDPWSTHYGLAIGDHAHGLHIGSLFLK